MNFRLLFMNQLNVHFFLCGGKLSLRCSSYNWCTNVRGDDLFGGSTVKVLSYFGEIKTCAILLGLDDVLQFYRVSFLSISLRWTLLSSLFKYVRRSRDR